jgi:hypothetical protein
VKISLPFYNSERTIVVPKWGTITLRPYQILAYLSLTERGYGNCNGDPIFPAVFDTGNSLNLTIHKNQLDAAKPWNMTFAPMRHNYEIRGLSGVISTAKALSANAWLHDYTPSTVPGSYEVANNKHIKAFKLTLAHEGIACIDSNSYIIQEQSVDNLFEKIISFFKQKDTNSYENNLQEIRQRNDKSSRLSLPHLPLLGLRALCINSLNIHMICNPFGGQIDIYDGKDAIITSDI